MNKSQSYMMRCLTAEYLATDEKGDYAIQRDGEPDIIFWIHNGDTAEDVVINLDAIKFRRIQSSLLKLMMRRKNIETD